MPARDRRSPPSLPDGSRFSYLAITPNARSATGTNRSWPKLDKRGIAEHREPDTVTVDDLIEAASYRVESSTSPKPFTLQE